VREFERDEHVAPRISVALCSYNGERFIAEQVASILAQSVLPDELVLSDDASTDSTVAIVVDAFAAFARDNPGRPVTLRVLENPLSLGVVKNFEQATRETTGDYVVLSDQDDRWRPDRIARALEHFESHTGLTLLHSDANLIDASGAPLGDSLFGALGISARERAQIRSGNAFDALLGRNLATGATTMFRRELLSAALPFPESWIHDEWLAVIAASTGRLEFLDERLIDYRQHGGNAIGAARLGLSGRLDKLREPREARNAALVQRANDLVDRLGQLGAAVRPQSRQQADAKLAHERARLGLPASHLRRVAPVLRELSAGAYSRYGRGLQDVLRDLVQPAR
jgi:glycosyltransferase involved in cell wall biosynthesis